MSDTESSEDEIEPKLKYARLSNDIQNILSKSSATSVAVHPKVFINLILEYLSNVLYCWFLNIYAILFWY